MTLTKIRYNYAHYRKKVSVEMKWVVWSLLLWVTSIFAGEISYHSWGKDKTFSDYLKEHNISSQLLENISKDDKKFLSELKSEYSYYELKDKNNVLIQSLIPISEEMQVHLFYDTNTTQYQYEIIPIAYKEHECFTKVIIENNPYVDTLKVVQKPKVAERISRALKNAINTKKLHKGDEISFLYQQKTRLGKCYAVPDIKIAQVKMKNKQQFIYVDTEGNGYKETGKSVPYTINEKKKVTYRKKVPVSRKNSRFGMPLRHIRITSSFSYRRWHPILHRYRPHHGTDFGAKRGTPLLAVNSGKVSFSGRMGGYGKVVKIKHAGGYESLYAHQSRIRVRRGQRVKKGQVIGYVGSTGRSTGPHLHFGLMKRGRWIDPMKVLGKKSIKQSKMKTFTKYKNVKRIKYRNIEIKDVKKNQAKLMGCLENETPNYIWKPFISEKVYVEDRKKFIKNAN